MNVSIREKEDCAISALNILVAALVKEYGYTPTFWLNYIYSSSFIKDLMNMETGYWGEGVAFHKYQLLTELKNKGVVV